jgi:hypothetical protein
MDARPDETSATPPDPGPTPPHRLVFRLIRTATRANSRPRACDQVPAGVWSAAAILPLPPAPASGPTAEGPA